MQKLEVFQSIWGMERRRPDGLEWAIEEQVEMIAEAGYAGMDLYSFRPEISRPANKLLQKAGLACTCCAFPKSIDGFQNDIDIALELGARHLNVIGQMYPMTVDEGADIIKRWLEMGDKSGMPVTIETHRDCITTDMLYTSAAHASHPGNEALRGRFAFRCRPRIHLANTVTGRKLDATSARSVGRASGSNREPRTNPNPDRLSATTGLVRKFQQWWEDGIRKWRYRESDDATLNFLVELGPPPYAMTDKEGWELSERWEEGLTIKGWVEGIWTRLETEGKANPE